MVSTELLTQLLEQHPDVVRVLTGLLILIGSIQYLLGPKQDWVESKRAKYFIPLHEFLSIVGAYSIGQSSPHEYSCTLSIDDSDVGDGETHEDVLERKLYENGFHRNALACKKYRTRNGRREWSEGSWVKRDSLLAKRQLHLTLYDGDDPTTFDCYVHDEYSNIRHPLKHLASRHMNVEEAVHEFKQLAKQTGLSVKVTTKT